MIAPRRPLLGTLALTLGALLAPASGWATDFHVGPGQAFTSIGAVPWYALQAGDTVYIHHQPTPYYEKVLISGRGTPSQWIRVLGVPGPNGELPVISGNNATTSTNMRYRWQAPSGGSAIQWNGLIQIAVRADGANGTAPLPGYIEIANLWVQDASPSFRFTAENGQTANFSGFSACVYARSVQHLIVRDSVMTNCGLGFYNWTGSGSNWWDGLQVDTVLRSNYFFNNGLANSYTEHQVYTESDGVTIEYNRFGPMRAGALGSQLKDRSAGTVIRYNYMEASPAGWLIDLVEPESGWEALGAKAAYGQAFVYGNIMLSRMRSAANWVHWNEDHQVGNVGRATRAGGKLFFYNNTVVTIANLADVSEGFHIFNTTYGGYDCPPGAAPPGVIEFRKNIFAVLPRTAGSAIPRMRFAYCRSQKFDFGRNWVTRGWTLGTAGTVTGTGEFVSPEDNDPGFLNISANDFRLAQNASAGDVAGDLAPEVTGNSLGLNLTPTRQYVYHQRSEVRSYAGAGSAVGAFDAALGELRRGPRQHLRIVTPGWPPAAMARPGPPGRTVVAV